MVLLWWQTVSVPLCLIFSLTDPLRESDGATLLYYPEEDWENARLNTADFIHAEKRRQKVKRVDVTKWGEHQREMVTGNWGKNMLFTCSSCPISCPSLCGTCRICLCMCIRRCVTFLTLCVHHALRCVCSCALSLVRKKRPLIEFPLISRQPCLAERDACLPAAQSHTSGMVDNGGWHFCPTMPGGSMWYMASSMKVKLS